MVKSVTKEVPASDSESEPPKSAKKSASVAKNASDNKGHAEDEAGGSGSGSGEEDEEEYEIEAILDARPGAFEGVRSTHFTTDASCAALQIANRVPRRADRKG